MVSEHVLVLNQNYEPLSVCTARRAVILVFLRKAEIIDKYAEPVRGVYTMFDRPSIVRLVNFVRIPSKGIMLSRKNILKRDGHQCQYCSTTRGPLTVDHVLPRYLGRIGQLGEHGLRLPEVQQQERGTGFRKK